MHKKRSIAILSIVAIFIVAGLIAAFVPIKPGYAVKEYQSFVGAIKLGVDFKSGVYVDFEAKDDTLADIDERLDSTAEKLADFVSARGYAGTVKRTGDAKIRVTMPDYNGPVAFLTQLGSPKTLVIENDTMETVFEASEITNAKLTNNQSGALAVMLDLSSKGNKALEKANNAGDTISVYFLDGESKMAITSEMLNGKLLLTNDGTTAFSSSDAAYNFSTQIIGGTFKASLVVDSNGIIEPLLGVNALTITLIAALTIIVLVFAYMIVAYRGLGLFADISLLVYLMLLSLLIFSMPGIYLSIAGVTGLLLSFIAGAAFNIIVLERINKEYREGKSLLASFFIGFKKSLAPCADIGAVAVISTIMMMIIGFFGVPALFDFAVTMLIGTLISFVCYVALTRVLLKLMLNINDTNDKFYGVKRGKNFVEPAPDDDTNGKAVLVSKEAQ